MELGKKTCCQIFYSKDQSACKFIIKYYCCLFFFYSHLLDTLLNSIHSSCCFAISISWPLMCILVSTFSSSWSQYSSAQSFNSSKRELKGNIIINCMIRVFYNADRKVSLFSLHWNLKCGIFFVDIINSAYDHHQIWRFTVGYTRNAWLKKKYKNTNKNNCWN